MIPLALAAVLLVQQQVPLRMVSAEGRFDSIQTASRQVITDVGQSVAELRSRHDLLRRAVFNQSDSLVVLRTREMRQYCQDLTAVARAAPLRLCRSCFAAATQRAINDYRAALPGVSRVGTSCSTQLAQYLRARAPAATVRRSISAISRTVVNGLFPYESRIGEVRRAFGLTGRAPPPRR